MPAVDKAMASTSPGRFDLAPPCRQQTGECTWFEPRRIGRGWDRYRQIFSDGAGALYAIAASDPMPYRQGDLLCCRHLGHATGDAQWADTERASSGWSGFKTVFCAVPG